MNAVQPARAPKVVEDVPEVEVQPVSLVAMEHPRLGMRQVRMKAVNKMRQNGWSVIEAEPEAPPPDEPPKRKRRSKPDADKPSETDSGGFFVPENKEGE